ncbi:hypothetical protein Nit79A3_1331 [Nitrosomonas sp. Is79A3]
MSNRNLSKPVTRFVRIGEPFIHDHLIVLTQNCIEQAVENFLRCHCGVKAGPDAYLS